MNYLSPIFYFFILVFFAIYFLIPSKFRYVVIFIGSYIFYGYSNIKILSVLIGITLISYAGGLIINRKRNKAVFSVFVILDIAVLVFFKYSNFIIANYNVLLSKLMSENPKIEQMNLLLPIGLSFMVFQSVTYLSDIYRSNVQVEKNIIRYGAFVAFFPTVLSGPIQKSRYLLPQIKNPNRFDGEQAKKGTILFVWGLFEKIMVANKLLIIVNLVFSDYLNYNSAYYIIAGIAFSIYIYADFSSYSDMARGISMIMGISIGKNFNNPYLSLSTSEFWNRWHISLNEWFIEEVYVPLGGNRKGILRKYVNIFIVFLISGLWHGANYHFIAWGCINGIIVILGNILRPYKSKLYEKLNVSENVESIIFCKRVVVFVLITLTWIFFNNGIEDSIYIVKKMIFFSPVYFFDQNLFSIAGTLPATFIAVVASVVFCIVQYKRIDEREEYNKFVRQPFMFQCLLIALLICICIFAVCATDATVNTRFLYFQF